MKTVRELTEDEMLELKTNYLFDRATFGTVSYGELADSENIPNQEIYDFYGSVSFTEDDFFCNQE